jgi:hypothetical protein
MLRKFSLAVATMFIAGASFGQTLATCSLTKFNYPGAVSTRPHGINRYGNIVGSATTTSGAPFGFIRYSDGTFKKVLVPNSSATQLMRRNASGVTVGFYQDSTGSHGVVISGGTYRRVDYPGAIGSALNGINVYGTIVGTYQDSAGHSHGFNLKDGKFSLVQFPGSTNTTAEDISDTGVIVGFFGSGDIHGFAFANGSYTAVDDPNSTDGSTLLTDLNASGTITGVAQPTANFPQGFIIRGGVLKRVAVPGTSLNNVNGINGYNVVVGVAQLSTTNQMVGFMGHCQ